MNHKSKQAAQEVANKTLAIMKTDGWTVRVWENLGWHWTLVKTGGNHPDRSPERHGYRRTVTVNEAHNGKFFSMIGYDQTGTILQHVEGEDASFEDPNEAVEAQLARWRKEAAAVVSFLSDFDTEAGR